MTTSLINENSSKPTKLSFSKAQEKVLYLEGLDCADCANKIEKELNRQKNIKDATVDFISQKVTLKILSNSNINEVLRGAVKIINDFEPDVKVSYTKIDKQNSKEDKKVELVKRATFIAGAVLFIVGMVFDFTKTFEFTLFFSAYILVGHDVLYKSFRNIKKGKVFDENFLMSIATIGAFLIGEYPEGVGVMLFYKVGEFFQSLAVNNSRRSISKLMDIKAEYANIWVDNEIVKVAPESVGIGEIVVVKPGERVPLDGVVTKGESTLDMSALSGESLPKEIKVDDKILSGSINLNSLIYIKVAKEFKNSTVSKILELIQNASAKKSKTENFITTFARYYTPFVVVVALMLATLPPLIIENATFSDWIYRALVFLVISCPCALVISIPLSYFAGIGASSKKGILIKGSSYLEALNSVKTVVFDKTGTLTKGVFKVETIKSFNGYSNDELLLYAAYAESFSTHPIAISIVKSFGKDIDKGKISLHENLSGFGVKSVVEDREILVGNTKLLDENGISFTKAEEIGSLVYVAIDKKFAGYIVVADEIKEDSFTLVENLKKVGIQDVVMLTGDNEQFAQKIAKQLHIDKVFSQLLPNQKVDALEEVLNNPTKDGKVAFVGDGINDAPSLVRADVGIAMGKMGSDAAIESADIVLMNDEPSKIVDAIKISKKTRNIAMQNIVLALGIKAILMILGALGVATMWEAVFGDVGVTIIAVLNAMRILRVK